MKAPTDRQEYHPQSTSKGKCHIIIVTYIMNYFFVKGALLVFYLYVLIQIKVYFWLLGFAPISYEPSKGNKL